MSGTVCSCLYPVQIMIYVRARVSEVPRVEVLADGDLEEPLAIGVLITFESLSLHTSQDWLKPVITEVSFP